MILSLKNVSYHVKNKNIISNLSLDIAENEFLTITGPSGSGKSTILKLLANLISPTEGIIEFRNKDINQYLPTEYRRKVSYCFQQPLLFGEKVVDNLRFPFRIRKQKFDQDKAVRALKAVDLTPDFLNKNITELSGGEKQRVALIRNILFKPDVLLLDEITTGLDDDSKEIVHTLIKEVHQNKTTIIQVTHDNDEIEHAGKIIKIVEGKLTK
ncbi:ABC transporter ATP-binding protein [Lactobacillus ultunensis]|uniref:ABC transporter, ATP-binding protein n=1 Tax=Lactobacillus ultunensis DSM 16047 TaxID=525365 RepID=C2EQY1_9LACO|nr:ATP-binding cassette domain-containing protein [Lactobacillus ultunensis]EEJ71134.1 ABC transporter, ATP-binding protein [Lactobacillus ultunensis DSM 16047]KRL82748.1 ABC superfamily ATP binding cassette transporter, ABC protein [Lactobacillus ultunensis DSM 16047]QQP28898.1 ATP-binding cassette domain-containing protein [Lactobacillus ultunensis]